MCMHTYICTEDISDRLQLDQVQRQYASSHAGTTLESKTATGIEFDNEESRMFKVSSHCVVFTLRIYMKQVKFTVNNHALKRYRPSYSNGWSAFRGFPSRPGRTKLALKKVRVRSENISHYFHHYHPSPLEIF